MEGALRQVIDPIRRYWLPCGISCKRIILGKPYKLHTLVCINFAPNKILLPGYEAKR
jgi:hypothetical protein